MSLSRRERLAVLGLNPVWRLRAAVAAAEGGRITAASPSPASVTQAEPRPTPEPSTFAAAVDSSGTAPQPTPAAAESSMDWDALQRSVLDCRRCELHASRTRAVFGVGDRQADWMFIGEAPGADEDRLGEPFVGQAGKLLDAMLAAIGLKRGENVCIANILKSRPPGNRDPRPDEVAACLPYLERQIDLIRPRIIVALGRFAAQGLLGTDTSISRLRGRLHDYRGVPLVVTYHPAYLLRNPPDKAKAWEDLCFARASFSRQGWK